MSKIILVLAIVLSFSSFSCDTTEPIPDNIQPGRRDYVWSIDSVDYGNLPGFIELSSI